MTVVHQCDLCGGVSRPERYFGNPRDRLSLAVPLNWATLIVGAPTSPVDEYIQVCGSCLEKAGITPKLAEKVTTKA